MSKNKNIDLKQYKLLIDTNLLVLYLVGTYNCKLIRTYNKTRGYNNTEYEILVSIMSRFKGFVTTPHILTEVSNLTFKLNKEKNYPLVPDFQNIIAKFTEEYIKSIEIINTTNDFSKFGLTDCSISGISKNKYYVITDDFNLYNYLVKQEIAAINFTHHRGEKFIKDNMLSQLKQIKHSYQPK